MLTNAQPRFGVESDTGTVFCYLTSRHFPAAGEVDLPDGTWDMAKVKELVLAGKPVTAALLEPVDVDVEFDKVRQANADFNATIRAKQQADADAAKADAEAKAKADADAKAAADTAAASGSAP